MTDSTFEQLFASATTQRGADYQKARDQILALEKQAEVLGKLAGFAADATDWRKQLTAEMIHDRVADEATYESCLARAAGELGEPRPLGGFTIKHRADAIAGLGEAVVPGVLEQVWKLDADPAGTETAAFFGALERLQDTRSVLPMIELTEKPHPTENRASAVSVLSRLGDPRGFEVVLRLAGDVRIPELLRGQSIRVLGRFDDTRASQQLTAILLDEHDTDGAHLAAAEGLGERLDPATRSAVAQALDRADADDLCLALVNVLGEIGIKQDIPALERVVERSATVAGYAQDAIEDIAAR